MQRTHTRSANPALLITLAAISLSTRLWAAEPGEHDHSHATRAPPPVTVATPSGDAMQNMMSMHEKWMSAKTPEERRVLMAEHMSAMQEGMKAMRQMAGKSGSTMPMRMDMMTMMMQMMMDEHSMMHMPPSDSNASPPKQP